MASVTDPKSNHLCAPRWHYSKDYPFAMRDLAKNENHAPVSLSSQELASVSSRAPGSVNGAGRLISDLIWGRPFCRRTAQEADTRITDIGDIDGMKSNADEDSEDGLRWVAHACSRLWVLFYRIGNVDDDNCTIRFSIWSASVTYQLVLFDTAGFHKIEWLKTM